jgi:hypothetical protein
MKDEQRDILNAEFQSLVDMTKEAQRLLRCDCISTCSFELERIKRKTSQLMSKLADIQLASLEP